MSAPPPTNTNDTAPSSSHADDHNNQSQSTTTTTMMMGESSSSLLSQAMQQTDEKRVPRGPQQMNADGVSVAAAAAYDQKYVKKWEQHYRQFLTQLQTSTTTTATSADGTCTVVPFVAAPTTQLFVPTTMASAVAVDGSYYQQHHDVLSVSSPSYTCMAPSFVPSSLSSNGSTISSHNNAFCIAPYSDVVSPANSGTSAATCLFSLGMKPPRRLLRSTSSDSVLDFPPFYSIRHQSLPMMVNHTVPEEDAAATAAASTSATSTATAEMCNTSSDKKIKVSAVPVQPLPRSDSDLAPTSASTSTHSENDQNDQNDTTAIAPIAQVTSSRSGNINSNDGSSNHSPLDRQNSAVTRAQTPPTPSKPIKSTQVAEDPMQISREAMREKVRVDEPEIVFTQQRPRATSDASSVSGSSVASASSSKSGKGSFLKNIFKRKKKKKKDKKSDRLVENERLPSERHSMGMLRLNQSDRQKVSALPRNVRSYDCLDKTRWKGQEKNVSKYASLEAPRSIPSTRSSVRSPMTQNHSMSSLPGDSSHSSGPQKIMKVAFTEFHNSQQFGVDSVNPYLGEDSSVHDGKLFSMFGPVEATPKGIRLSCSMPISPDIRRREENLLFPVEGTESWTKGNRYLIAPALLSQCPVNVLQYFWDQQGSLEDLVGDPSINDIPATSDHGQMNPQHFGRTILGAAAGVEIGKIQKDVACDWLPRVFVLCQNYLLEYELDDDINSRPHGFLHLQNTLITRHPIFVNALEIEYMDPSSSILRPKRKLLFRLPSEEIRNSWVSVLSKAATLGINDIYEFHEEMGHGRYASIFKAQRVSSAGSECALKVIDKNEFWGRVSSGRERVDTLVREVAVQATLTSGEYQDFFVKIHGIFETTENFVLELELLDGTDLFRHISSKMVLEEYEAALIMRDILMSLATTRRLGIAHRDVKLANILMCTDFNGPGDVSVKLADYGMGTFVGVDGLVRGRCGTPGYVAPEILCAGTNCGYGNKVDLFSAGVVMYVLLCGYEPFYGETDAQLIAANKAAIVEFDELDFAGVSDEAKDLVAQLLDSDPRSRIDAEEALQHPWIVNRIPPSKW
eukprot:CAMPEP_0196823910 /NCGR_PEP_ID=MMETSP1362-20130617/89545_1 /TAXON_ID=163516 /ORGANISM="Leptocylindrus danicus, Strain CCMP1856" /LENGTH=1075 /DNA_ID=CAMNT_0042203963 /DNA_START=171 /DNA_END=3395 /DNA_ORIENTATION=-